MNISKQQDGDKLVIALEGRLDTTTAPQLEAEVSNSLEGVKELVLDFKALEYISSAGLRVVLQAQKKMNTCGSMEVHNANESIMEVFDITGFSDILTIK